MIEIWKVCLIQLLIIAGCVWCQSAAYRNGVRDGYCNPWIPHVRRQIKQQRLVQAQKENDCP